ncbi:hypothetical protein C3L33_18199, partial [Rhododendron williamsianum]
MAVSSSTTAAALHYISKPQQNYAPRTTTTTTCSSSSSCSFSVSITSSLSKTTKKPLKVTVRSSSDGSASAETTVTQAEAEAESESPIELPKGPPSVISTLNVERALRGIRNHLQFIYIFMSKERIDKENLYFNAENEFNNCIEEIEDSCVVGSYSLIKIESGMQQLQILITMAVLEFRKDVQMIRSAIKTSPVLNLGTSSSLGPGRAVVAFSYKNKVEELMNKGFDEEELSKKLEVLQESYAVLSNAQERRLYDWSLARKANPDKYLWPYE